jgi:nucleoside-diphosphate-sugar epimerase
MEQVMASPKKPALITGGAGLIGRMLIDRLQAHYAALQPHLAEN